MRALLLLEGILLALWLPPAWQQGLPPWGLLAAAPRLWWWRPLRIALPVLLGASAALHVMREVTTLPRHTLDEVFAAAPAFELPKSTFEGEGKLLVDLRAHP